MSSGIEQGGSGNEGLSALADGELDPARCGAILDAWRGDTALRRSWHAYHLIGDVLRSEDLASSAGRDGRLLAAVRARLANEPVVLAPTPSVVRGASPARAAPSKWLWSSAIAAGFVLVAGAFMIRSPAPEAGANGTAIAQNAAPGPAAVPTPTPTLVSETSPDVGEPVVANVRMIRDARLDRYLAAHKQFAGSSALGVPSAFLRSATVESDPAR